MFREKFFESFLKTYHGVVGSIAEESWICPVFNYFCTFFETSAGAHCWSHTESTRVCIKIYKNIEFLSTRVIQNTAPQYLCFKIQHFISFFVSAEFKLNIKWFKVIEVLLLTPFDLFVGGSCKLFFVWSREISLVFRLFIVVGFNSSTKISSSNHHHLKNFEIFLLIYSQNREEREKTWWDDDCVT